MKMAQCNYINCFLRWRKCSPVERNLVLKNLCVKT